MSRSLDSTILSNLENQVLYPFYTVSLGLDTPINIWSRPYPQTIDGTDYFNSDDLISISQITENNQLAADGLTINFGGTTATSLIFEALNTNYQGRTISVGFGLDVSGTLYVSEVFSGEIDTISVVEDFTDTGIETEVVLTAESIAIRLGRSTVRRFNGASQQAKYPGDHGLSFVDSVANKTLTWGKPREV